MKFVVTGCPRSGTTYMTLLLQELGARVGHECFFENCLREPNYSLVEEYENDALSDVSWFAAPYLRLFPDMRKVHLVRHPMRVIESFLHIRFFDRGLGDPNQQAALDFLDYFLDMSALDRDVEKACMFWVCWNKMCQGSPNMLTVRIEDFPNEVVSLVGFLNLDVGLDVARRICSDIPTNVNTRGRYAYGDMIEDSDLLRFGVVEMAREFGYLLL